MNLHPTLATQFRLITAAHPEFSTSSYSAPQNGAPITHCTLAKALVIAPATENSEEVSTAITLDLALRDDDRCVAILTAIIPGPLSITSGEMSFPHPQFDKRLAAIENACKGAVPEVTGRCDRGYFVSILAAVVDALNSGKTGRAKALATYALKETGDA